MARTFACRDEAAAEVAVRTLADEGVTVATGAVAPARSGAAWLVVVADREAARDALRASLAGVDLVLRRGPDADVWAEILEDLRHLGPVQHVDPTRPPQPNLHPDALALLSQLSAGADVTEAARRVGLSRRTADRRLGVARRVLGADSTVGAIVIARREGLL